MSCRDGKKWTNNYIFNGKEFATEGPCCAIYSNEAFEIKRISDSLIKRPENAEEFVASISKFKGLITARLHSCIVAYSLQIPLVALSWTAKVEDFMKLIGLPSCAVNIKEEKYNTDIDHMVNAFILNFEEVMQNGYDKAIYKQLKEQIINEVNKLKAVLDR